jgi:UDP-N-acetyl-D-glucosamine/UDP-N-acetyl-D-galactosamine dehydrogenase
MMYEALISKQKSVAVIGLGYVGLPLALAFARHFRVIGFDLNPDRIHAIRRQEDPSKELEVADFMGADIRFTSNPADLKDANFFIVAVPTDIDEHKTPNLVPLKTASKSVGEALKPGDYVVFESTVYPGCTEEDCIPVL